MTIEYRIKRKVYRLGKPGGLVIALPKIWCDANSVKQGEEILLAFDSYGYLKVIPGSSSLEDDNNDAHGLEPHKGKNAR